MPPVRLTEPLRAALVVSVLFNLLATSASAQLSNLPNLATITGSSASPQPSKSTATTRTTTGADTKQTSTHPRPTTTFAGSSSALPTVSVSTSTFQGLSNAPTLEGVGIPTLVVPDTSNAPFRQRSNLPEGTVFICVGAALAFLGLGVIAWRALVAYSLHRSVRRAASAQYASEKKAMYRRTSAYPSVYNSENVSLEHLAATNTSYQGATGAEKSPATRVSAKPGTKAHRSSRDPANSSLFFSPTAGAGAGLHSASSRSSTFLPPGYYASGSAAPASGANVAHVGGATSGGYTRVDGNPSSPPSTPGARVTESGRSHGRQRDSDRRRRNGSTSAAGSLSLGLPPQGRAPSAFLDDLFENHGSAMS